MSERRVVRQSNEIGIRNKRFRPVVGSNRSRVKLPATADIVIIDLRRGNLSSLDDYLRMNKGLPDRRVAVELRKLLSSKQTRSKYQIIAVERPRSSGRTKKSFGASPTPKQFQQAKAYREHRKAGDQAEYAAAHAARDCKTSPGAILKSERVVSEFENEIVRSYLKRIAREEALANAVKNRNNAQEAIRKRYSKPE